MYLLAWVIERLNHRVLVTDREYADGTYVRDELTEVNFSRSAKGTVQSVGYCTRSRGWFVPDGVDLEHRGITRSGWAEQPPCPRCSRPSQRVPVPTLDDPDGWVWGCPCDPEVPDGVDLEHP